jgi:demethylmenaquinone methyltransferase/2-methoxy-6-polyprenyl-1,4-benzoquinol methylase
MPLSSPRVEAAYQRHAKTYDLAVKLYGLIGLPIEKYRSRALELLQLQRGDCVIDLGCGTGLSFPLLMKAVGTEGHLVGVDVSSEMLACAQERVKRANWENVQLVHADIATYDFPAGVNGVLATGVFGYVRERERVIENISKALVPGGRLVIVDGKRPDRWPSWLFKLFVWCSSPFGVTEDYFDSHTWESVGRYFENPTFEEGYGGLMYLSSGVAVSRPVS